MTSPERTTWLPIRVSCALGVLMLLSVELAGHRTIFVVVPQALLIAVIIVTSVLDLRHLRRRHEQAPGRSPE